MKKFRFLFALVVVITTLFTVAMATDGTVASSVLSFEKAELDYNAEGMEVVIETNVDLSSVGALGFGIKYDATWNIENIVTGSGFTCTPSTVTIDNVEYPALIVELPTPAASIAAGTDIVKFTVKADEFAVGKTIDVYATYVEWNDAADYWWADSVETDISAVIKAAAPAAGDPTYALDKAMVTLNGASGEVYTNVWSGAYTVDLNGNVATALKVDFDADHSYEVAGLNLDGEGTVDFSIAVVGAPRDAQGVPSIFTTEWIAAVLAD